MKCFKTIIGILSCFSVLSLTLNAQNTGNNSVINRLEVLQWLKEYNVPAVGIGIMNDGKLVDCEVFGEQKSGTPASDSTIYTMASLTKPIISMVTLKLIQNHQWDLDAPLADYWIDPDVKDNTNLYKLSTRYVLSHRSGFPNWRQDTESRKLMFNFEPGTKYQYSGEGFEYLRKALENKFHKTIEELADSVLFIPLEMKDTKFHWEKEIDSTRFAYRHNTEGKQYPEALNRNANGAYGLLTTVEDYSRFGIDVMNKAGLSDELFNEMISTQINIKQNIDQGLGWEIIRNLPSGESALYHQGGAKGVETIVVLFPTSKRGIVVFTNSDNGDKVYSKILENYFDSGKEVLEYENQMSYNPDEIKTVDVPKDVLSSYTGTYFMSSFQMSVKIVLENNILTLNTSDAKITLLPQSETRFFAKEDDLIIEFIKDENNTTKGFNFTFRGNKPEFSSKIKL